MAYYVVTQDKPPQLGYWRPGNFMSRDIATLKEARALAEYHADDRVDEQVDGWQYAAAIYKTTGRDDAPPVAIVRPNKARAKRAELQRIYAALNEMIWPDRSKLWEKLTRAQRAHFDREYRGIR